MSGWVPSAYKPEYCDLIKELATEGSTHTSFCAQVGISRSTFYLWRKKHPEFEEAACVADMLCGVWWEMRAKEAASISGSKGAPSIILSALYNRANQFWRNKQEFEQTVRTGEDELDLTKLTDEELAAYDLLVAARERNRNREE